MKTDSIYCIAIDTGNTRTHIGLIRKSDAVCINNISFFTSDIDKKILSSIEWLWVKSNSPHISETVISSVVKNADLKIKSILKKRFGPVIDVKFTKDLKSIINYKYPESLGADRIADTLYCCFTHPESNVLIIDAGTAIKTDVIINSQFLGGTIIPGIETQFRSLHDSTSALPLIESFSQKITLPGISTSDCMIGGIIHGTAGALNNFVNIYKKKYSHDMIVLTTGGAWHHFKNLVNFEHEHIPELTLIGTSLYTLFSGKQANFP